MENEAFVSYRDYPRQRRTLDRILQKLLEQDLPGAPYVEQYLRHMHRRDVTAHTLRAAFTIRSQEMGSFYLGPKPPPFVTI